jgi:hypothetical protein
MAIAPPYSALLDATTSALLFLSTRIPVIVFLTKAMSEADHEYCVNYPNYLQEFPQTAIEPVRWPEWTWNGDTRLFEPTPKELITERLTLFAALAGKKAQALVEVIRTLTMARYPVWEGMPMQDVIYVTKKLQAQRYKDAGYPEGANLDYSYVLQWADFAGLSMKAAADEILLKASFADDQLLKSELFRLKYYGRIRDVNTVEEVDRLVLDFRREFYKSAEVHREVYPL